MSPVEMINISMSILVIFESRRFRKAYIDLSNNTFSIDTVIVSLFHYIWEFDLFIKIVNFNDCLEV